ncbi:ferrous iron transport protein B [Roseospirillum parvum]|uniref:Ferrous iron transport protein B n=1 Tax=Roseospirillum parvum TaxID=83401 RepID=A0A1G8EL38_9PROT|nr:ferrous iron transport protein B [Roseospirillum parvum]SDH70625.1 ferrous iron transport protein B [Roseospirillum parvum]
MSESEASSTAVPPSAPSSAPTADSATPASGTAAEGAAPLLVALAGQQNAGKSTLFNALTGVHQHIANYPGVTVDKKSGRAHIGGRAAEVVDLPGTYSLTSFSLEERVAREFLLDAQPDVVVNVLDATNIRRGLYLTFQLLEMGYRVVVALNMMDVAERRGLAIDLKTLSARLGVPVVGCVGRRGVGIDQLKAAIAEVAQADRPTLATLNYGELEAAVSDLQARLSELPAVAQAVSPRWLATKLIEGDAEAGRLLAKCLSNPHGLLDQATQARQAFEEKARLSTGDHMVAARDHLAGDILATCVTDGSRGRVPISERVDRFLLNRWLAPLFLVLVVWAIYELSIVQGYELTKVTWPILAGLRNLAADWLPEAGFLVDPQVRSLGLWMVDSANTLLNYVPIFLILFALIAILEDSGYMARIAFILDRILHRFGLHGQSTLPFILAGVFAGGCAVPGVMATKGIPDQRARLATILTVPFMNCLAKVPLYTLLINIYFPENKGLILFYLSTITVIAALLVAKLLTVSVLRNKETAPFVMELPHYHLPTITGVLRRSVDRTWLYVKKVGTVVVAVAAVVYVLLQFPGLTPAQQAGFQARGEAAIGEFFQAMEGNPLAERVSDQETLVSLLNVYTAYKAAKLNSGGGSASQAVDARFEEAHPQFFPFLKISRDRDARDAARALKDLSNTQKTLRREMKDQRIVNSFLGQIGRGLEPITQFANFDWKINVALLSSFAARESSVATLGVLFEQEQGENLTLEERMGSEQKAAGYTALTAVAIMLFFALYPPCLATTIMVRVQTNSYRWMTFSIIFPTFLGLGVASLVYSVGTALELTGLQMFTAIYLGALALLILVGLFKPPFGRGLSRPAYASPPAASPPAE